MFNQEETEMINGIVLEEFKAKGVKFHEFGGMAFLFAVDYRTRLTIHNRISQIRESIRTEMRNDEEYRNELKNIEERYERDKQSLEDEWKAKHLLEALHNAMERSG